MLLSAADCASGFWELHPPTPPPNLGPNSGYVTEVNARELSCYCYALPEYNFYQEIVTVVIDRPLAERYSCHKEYLNKI